MARKKPRPCKTCKYVASPRFRSPRIVIDRSYRLRKVKCDESWPVCSRCVSTGRVCDGYGIWGGGGNTYQERITSSQDAVKSISKPCQELASVAESDITPQENLYIEWFFRRSVLKLPGIFKSDFWDFLVLQASSKEPAVLHAVLALSAVHRREVAEIERYNALDKQEQFALRQYSKAITNLQPHLSSQNKASLRVALIACLIFVSMEFLRGRYKTGNIHLQNGLRLVNQFTPILWPSFDTIDQHILETFIRLQLQTQLFGQRYKQIYTIPKSMVFDLYTAEFHTVAQARQRLDHLLTEILLLAKLRRQETENAASTVLLETQSHLRSALGAWFENLMTIMNDPQINSDIRAKFSYKLLSLYHTMAGIMIETCLETTSESIYDNFDASFLSLLSQAINIRNSILGPTLDVKAAAKAFPGHGRAPPFGSIVDIAWIPPLYYVAIKCRIHRIRVHAVKFLMSDPHKEGIWDSQLAGRIAQEVMEIEEGDYYKDFPINDDFPISVPPGADDLLLPALPEVCWVYDLELMLPDDPMEKLGLMCKRRDNNGTWGIISKEITV